MLDDRDAREIRAAQNQAMFRAINERITELNQAFEEILGTFSITCECADLSCITLIEIPYDDYRAVRENPRRFVVLPDHVYPDVETVVSRADGYTVVEAIGRGAQEAEGYLWDQGANATQ
jgi:hypothetical protein